MEIKWIDKKDIGRDGEILDFLYPVTGLVICGGSVWKCMEAGQQKVVCLTSSIGSDSLIV
jgi:hypothetical protein